MQGCGAVGIENSTIISIKNDQKIRNVMIWHLHKYLKYIEIVWSKKILQILKIH